MVEHVDTLPSHKSFIFEKEKNSSNERKYV